MSVWAEVFEAAAEHLWLHVDLGALDPDGKIGLTSVEAMALLEGSRKVLADPMLETIQIIAEGQPEILRSHQRHQHYKFAMTFERYIERLGEMPAPEAIRGEPHDIYNIARRNLMEAARLERQESAEAAA